jgi:hypothetical protein
VGGKRQLGAKHPSVRLGLIIKQEGQCWLFPTLSGEFTDRPVKNC